MFNIHKKTFLKEVFAELFAEAENLPVHTTSKNLVKIEISILDKDFFKEAVFFERGKFYTFALDVQSAKSSS